MTRLVSKKLKIGKINILTLRRYTTFRFGEIRHSDGQNRQQVELIQRNGKTECDRAVRKKNGADDDGDAAAY